MNIRRGFLALAAMILGVGLASSAQAQVTTVPVTQGGVTCQKVIGGTYPEDGHIYQCTSSSSYNLDIQNRPRNIMNGTWGTNAKPGQDMKEKFAGAPVDFYAFENAVDAEAFLANAGIPNAATKLAYFNKWAGSGGWSLDPAVTSHRAVIAVKNRGVTGNYPTTVSQNPTDFSHTIVHEMGHNFDFLSKSSLTGNVYPSWSVEFDRVAQIDDAWLFTQTHSDPPPNDYATFKDDYGYWLNKDPNKKWAELFAEQFAKRIHGTAGSQPAQGADSVIQAYYTCTNRYVEWFLRENKPPQQGTTDYNTARCN
jgi:hypothetical protein